MTRIKNTYYVELKQSIYREYSLSYDEDRDRFVSGSALEQRIDWALEPLSPGGSLLDLGCGTGRLLRRAIDRTDGRGLLAGPDLTPDMLALARAELDDRVVLIEGNAAARLPIEDGTFDVVTSLNLIQELPTDAVTALFENVHRILRPCGMFRAVIPCMAAANNAADMFRQMTLLRGAMDFRYAHDLEELLISMPGFIEKTTRIQPSPAAANAAKGGTRFSLFTDILSDIESLGLDPSQVQQGVVFFSGRRGPESK